MPDQLTYIDLFAGCGGLSLGLFKAGLKGLFAVERNPDAFETLKHNLIAANSHFEWPSWLSNCPWDINKLLKKQTSSISALKGRVDLVVGGPPCQGFSSAGERVASDKRNKLIHSYLEFVEQTLPHAVMFENVRGFMLKFPRSRRNRDVPFSEQVIAKLHELGYKDARGEMINVSAYGIPQQRQRFIVVATRQGLANDIFDHLERNREGFLSSHGLVATQGAQDALSDLERQHGEVDCPDTAGFKSGKISHPKSNLQKLLRLCNQDTYVPDSHRFVNHTAETQEVFKRLIEKAPKNKRIDGDARISYGLKKRNVSVMNRTEPTLTITTIPDDFVHYCEPRVMTVRESARLQTFPDWFEFKGPYTTGGKRRVKQTPRYTQVGNAVPPLFAEQLGIALKHVLANG